MSVINALKSQAKTLVDNEWEAKGKLHYPEAHTRYIQEIDKKFIELIKISLMDKCASVVDYNISSDDYRNAALNCIDKIKNFGVDE